MRYLSVSGTIQNNAMPELFRIIADSAVVEEARVVDWNLGSTDSVTVLYAIDGDCEAARAALVEAPEVIEASASVRPESPASDGYLLVRVDTTASSLAQEVFEMLSTPGLVVLKPVVYRNGRVNGRLVGETEVLQAVVDHLPETVETEIRQIGAEGSLPLPEARADALSERQQEAVEAALELGYYDRPRQATHEDIADRLGCAPSTATEHLQKAEAALVRAAIIGHGT